MTFRILYSETSRNQIRALNPELKPIVKRSIEKLEEDPFLGKAVERDLSGYRSLRTRRFRVLYKLDDESRTVQIHYVGPRKDVYELFKEYIRKEK
jgi:mRNA-degrading endonuclease RelE of RelBE toxin-antitoxin system